MQFILWKFLVTHFKKGKRSFPLFLQKYFVKSMLLGLSKMGNTKYVILHFTKNQTHAESKTFTFRTHSVEIMEFYYHHFVTKIPSKQNRLVRVK